MPFFASTRRAKAKFESMLLSLRRQLENQYSTTEETGLSFIHPEKTGRILTREAIHSLFEHCPWYEKNHDDLWQFMRLIICTLISIGWDGWDQFPRYFFYQTAKPKYARFTDKDLPIATPDFLDFVPPEFSKRFLSNQHIFKPIFIHESSHCQYSKDRRLPILKTELNVEGAQGVVEKVTIDSEYLHYTNKTARNHKPQVMAYKRIRSNTNEGQHDFETEQRVLIQFRKSISQHSNIMQSFASFLHGSDFVILSPWAAGRDLNLFLRAPEQVFNDWAERSFRFSPDNLLTEACNLARALHFLHFELLSPRSRRLHCAHTDLKPDNVLVEFLPDEKDAPVGRWKISDFGLSRVEEAVTENQVMPIGREVQEASWAPGNIAGELSFTPRTRGPGPFQPPEVYSSETARVSTRRDVWSYGCILTMVLAFALGGPQEVEEQRRKRAVGGDDYFYRRLNRQSRTPRPSPEPHHTLVDAELKPGIRRWLESKGRENHDLHKHWIKPCVKLIFDLLAIDVITRPEINEAILVLDRVTLTTERSATDRFWSFEEPHHPTPVPLHPLETNNHRPIEFGANSPGQESIPVATPLATTPVHRMTASNRSSVSRISLSSASDPSLSFGRLEPPTRRDDTGAALDPYARSAALWSSTELKLYVLEGELNLRDRFVESHFLELEDHAKSLIVLLEQTECLQVRICGQWFAILERFRQSQYRITTYFRPDPHQARHHAVRKEVLRDKPLQFELSSQGALAVHSLGSVRLYTRSASAPIDLDKSFMGMAFSGNGDYFCLWESDDSYGENFYWTVWSLRDVGNQTEIALLGQTISHIIKVNYINTFATPS